MQEDQEAAVETAGRAGTKAPALRAVGRRPEHPRIAYLGDHSTGLPPGGGCLQIPGGGLLCSPRNQTRALGGETDEWTD